MKMPDVFVIAPDEMPERQKAVKDHLEGLGIAPKLFSGLWGSHMALRSSRGKSDHPYFKLTENRIALALNHWFLWQHIVMSGIPEAIIFEDDVFLPDNFNEFFDESMKNTPAGWDMVYLSILYPERIADGRIGAANLAGNVWQYLGARTWDGACDGLHAYMLTLEGARKMVGVPFALDEPIDRWVSFHISPMMKTYIWHPSVVQQRSGMGQWASTTQAGDNA